MSWHFAPLEASSDRVGRAPNQTTFMSIGGFSPLPTKTRNIDRA